MIIDRRPKSAVAAGIDESKKADLAIALWENTAQRRYDRRSYEWKIAFGMWAALLLATQLVVKNATVFDDLNKWVVFGVGLFIVVVVLVAYGFVLYGQYKGYGDDLRTALIYEKKVRDLVSQDWEDAEKWKCIAGRKAHKHHSVFELLVTFLLLAVLFAALISVTWS